MRKLLCRTSAVILALSIVGCDSLPFLGGAGEEEVTPESSPSPTAEAPASPTPSPTPEEPFASPDVPQKPPGAPALIQSSNPEERVSQLEREIGTSGQAQTSTPPTTFAPPPGRDPFAVDVPIPPPPKSEDPAGGTSIDGPVVVTQLPSQRVPQLPSIPEISAPNSLDGQKRDGVQIPDLARGRLPQLPQVPELTSPPQAGGTRGTGTGTETGTGTGTGTGRNIPSQAGGTRGTGGNIPLSLDAGGPRQLGQLPQIPTDLQAPSLARSIGEGPIERMPEIPPIAIEPRGVPNLPELPVQDPPPVHPSARPPEPLAGGGEEAPPPPPPPPSTVLAEGVKVTGVVEVGNEKQVIIEAPNEATSRYVKVGQRVAGGKVLIKRVDFENGEAIVILEENDVEIRKIVGEEPAVE